MALEHIMPVKYGGKHNYQEAYVNKKTGVVETTAWDSAPPNSITDGDYIQKPASDVYKDSWERIFGGNNVRT